MDRQDNRAGIKTKKHLVSYLHRSDTVAGYANSRRWSDTAVGMKTAQGDPTQWLGVETCNT